jgi:Uma2 family endonuclease
MRRGGQLTRNPRTIGGMTSGLGIRYVRPVVPLRFDSTDPEWEMGQSPRHLKLCVTLYQLLGRVAGEGNSVGSDEFVYYDASNRAVKCAPDAFVKLGIRNDSNRKSWTTWKHGTPELCIEVLSPSDTEEKQTLVEKLDRFHAMGVEEVVVFDVDASPGERLRAWDRVDGDLVERVVENERTPCLTLGLFFVVAPVEEHPAALRLSRDVEGRQLVPTDKEEAAAALARVAELEAELKGRRL